MGRLVIKPSIAGVPGCSPKDEVRLRAAGFRPVLRWIEGDKATAALKTIEALTLLDRREGASKGKKG